MGVSLAISRRSLFILRGIASFWWGDKVNLAVAQIIPATPYTQTWAKRKKEAKKQNEAKTMNVFGSNVSKSYLDE